MKFIGYYRVSTQKQGIDGLGMEAQKMAVEQFTKEGQLLNAYTEVESGRKVNRPELAKALQHAKSSKATLVVARLDRLARNVAFLSALMESGVDFVCVDNPHATRLTIHILAAVAEEEVRMVSIRTKAALQAYKARGGLLGSARPECAANLKQGAAAKGRARAMQVRTDNARKAYAYLVPTMQVMRDAGATLWEIANHLNKDGHTTTRGNQFNANQVRLVLERYTT